MENISQDNINKAKNLERAILFGSLKKEDLSEQEHKLLDEYKEQQKEDMDIQKRVIDMEQTKRFLKNIGPFLPSNVKQIKLLGNNWFYFELEGKKFMSYYYLQQNNTPIFSCLSQI